jgi:hypothetical protein
MDENDLQIRSAARLLNLDDTLRDSEKPPYGGPEKPMFFRDTFSLSIARNLLE